MLSSIYIQVSKRCNLRCKHCFNDSNSSSTELFDPARAEELANQAAAMGCRVAVITGGEPTLTMDSTCALAQALIERGIVPIVYSHMSSVRPQQLERLRTAGVFIIHTSLDSPDPDEHDWFRGSPGSFRRTVDNVHRAMDEGFEIWARMTLTTFNHLKAVRMADFLADLSVRSFRVRPMVPVGRASREFCLRSTQLRTTVGQLLEWRGRNAGRIDITFLPTCFEFLLEPIEDRPHIPCFIAKAFIAPNGDVQGCNYFTPVLGNVFETPLPILWPAYAQKVQDSIGSCETCDSCASWHVCHGGCKANNAAYGIPLSSPDPLCFMASNVQPGCPA
jgi:radical SAM protein with 4Fe4S-binding SPASM domain